MRLALLASTVSGCGGADRYQTVPVSGVVTCQGKPVANGAVSFTPLPEEGRDEGKPGRMALGITDAEGRFRLTTYVENDGAIVGRHSVSVDVNVDEELVGKRQQGPAFPCSGASQEVTVKKGMGELKLEF